MKRDSKEDIKAKEINYVSFLFIFKCMISLLQKFKEKDQKSKNCCFVLIHYLRADLPEQTYYVMHFQHTALSAKFNCNNLIFQSYSPCSNTYVTHFGFPKNKKQSKTKQKLSVSNK